MNRRCCLALGLLGFLPAATCGADWPQYRYDAGRTAASPEALPAVLHLQWTWRLPEPRPVFPGEVRLRFDASYEPVVAGKTMFLPSMVTDSLTALDIDTGQQRWQFFAEGPVRFAPIAWQGKVYFVSDDGHLYCVDAGSGHLQWKFCGRPAGAKDRRLLGNRRLISLWPAWGGPVLHDGVLYFGCGIWSTYGVCVHAIEPGSGKVLWTNADSNHIAKANMDHGIANEAGLTPQGYLAVVNDKLVVPCGAQLPAFLDLKTGALGKYTMGWGGRNGLPKGTWFVAGAGHYLSHSGDLYDLTRVNDEKLGDPRWPTDFKSMLYAGEFTRLCIDRTNQKDLGEFSQPAFANGLMYENQDGIVARDLASIKMELRNPTQVPAYRRDDTYPDKWTTTFREMWRLGSDRKVHIKAGPHLYVGGPGVIEAIRIPQAGEQPRVVWQTPIEGMPHRLLAADGKLFVVTREGSLFAFGGEEKTGPAAHRPAETAARPADSWTKTAADILQATGVREGYAVVLGAESGRLAEELVRQSQLDVIAIERDAGKADQIRQRLHQAGLYGTRASVHVGDPLSYPLTPYLANLVVSENWANLGNLTDQKVIDTIYAPLRPYGGRACLSTPAAERESLLKQVAERSLAGASVKPVGDWVLLSRDGALPGSAGWTHEQADAAGTGASEDRFVRSPFELLWFDTPKRWFRTPGSAMARVCGGRLLIKSNNVQAVDVFTGRPLWEASLAFPATPNDQFVALDDAIYVSGGATCLVLDPITGHKSGQIDLPAGLTAPWSNLRAWQGYLVGQSGKHVVCLDRHSGQLRWDFECGRPALSIAVGGGKVFVAEVINKLRGETERDGATRALAIESGKVLWAVPSGSEVRYSSAADLVVTSAGIYRAQDGALAASVPQPPAADPKIPPQNSPRPLFVVGGKMLFGTAENLTMYDLPTGTKAGDPFLWTRRGCTIPRASSHLITTRFRGNAACIDLATRDIVPLWNVRAACSNNLFPADGVLNVPSMTGGCTCNYLPVSQGLVPAAVMAQSPVTH